MSTLAVRDAGWRHRSAGELGEGRRRHVRGHGGGLRGLRRPAARSPHLRDVRRFVAAARQRGAERGLDEQHAQVRGVDDAGVAGVEQLHSDRGRRRRGPHATQTGGRQGHHRQRQRRAGPDASSRPPARRTSAFRPPGRRGLGVRLFDDNGGRVPLDLAGSERSPMASSTSPTSLPTTSTSSATNSSTAVAVDGVAVSFGGGESAGGANASGTRRTPWTTPASTTSGVSAHSARGAPAASRKSAGVIGPPRPEGRRLAPATHRPSVVLVAMTAGLVLPPRRCRAQSSRQRRARPQRPCWRAR